MFELKDRFLQSFRGHLGAALYGQRAGPRLALHTAVEHGSDSMVGQLVQFGANVGVPIETRHVHSKKMWLPIPPADVDATGKVNDEFKKSGKKVAKSKKSTRKDKKHVENV